jgi:hypothetical protein
VLIRTADDVTCRFAPLSFEPKEARTVRGLAWALALHWLAHLPDGPDKRRALDQLAAATESAVSAVHATARF